MKGVVLAGGHGTRLEPLTNVTNKHLLPIYNKPMIYYPIETLLNSGINDILIVAGDDHVGSFLRLLGSGKSFGAKFSYEIQKGAGGIAQALSLAEDFAMRDNIAVILGDNIFEDTFESDVLNFDKGSDSGARIFLSEVNDASRFGVAELDGDRVVGIEEKPSAPKSNLAVTGLYFYDSRVFDVIRGLTPSARGEYEITDVNNNYISNGKMKASILSGQWTDAGTFDSLFKANKFAYKMHLKRTSTDSNI